MASRNSSKNSCASRFCGGLLRTSLAKLPSMVTVICDIEAPGLKTVLCYLRRPLAEPPRHFTPAARRVKEDYQSERDVGNFSDRRSFYNCVVTAAFETRSTPGVVDTADRIAL